MAAMMLAALLAGAAAPVEVLRWPTAEATQGAVADRRHVYAIGNNAIGKYDKRTGRRIAAWTGPRALFPHINSCAVAGTRLVCAASNYPAVPQASSVEIFDTRRMVHIESRALPPLPGSLTFLYPRRGGWWAGLANYDGRGGVPGRDHRATLILTLDTRFVPVASWLLPATVLERMAPYSVSGGVEASNGLLYLSGHDRPELYRMRLPRAGTVLEHAGTLAWSTQGQAVGRDGNDPQLIWSIDRTSRDVVATRVSIGEMAGRR